MMPEPWPISFWMSTTAGATALATAATGSSAPSPGKTGEGASFTGGDCGVGVGAGAVVAGGVVDVEVSGGAVGAASVAVSALAVLTGVMVVSDDATDRPTTKPVAATTMATTKATASQANRGRDGWDAKDADDADDAEDGTEWPTVGGAVGHCGRSAVPIPDVDTAADDRRGERSERASGTSTGGVWPVGRSQIGGRGRSGSAFEGVVGDCSTPQR